MEIVNEMEDGQTLQEVYENDIDFYLHDFCEIHKIKPEELHTISQSRWNAALMHIRRKAFPDKSVFKSKNRYDNQNRNGGFTTYNAYDYGKVNMICDYYIMLCMAYDKEVSVIGFSNLTGIEDQTIHEWGNGQKLSTTSSEICKKLVRFREESLSNKLATGNKNPVGVLAILNRHYQWNLPGVSREQGGQRALTADQLPKLGQIEHVALPDQTTEQ